MLANGTPRRTALTDGFSSAFWFAAAFAAVALLATLLVIRRRDLAQGDVEGSDGPLGTTARVGEPAARTAQNL